MKPIKTSFKQTENERWEKRSLGGGKSIRGDSWEEKKEGLRSLSAEHFSKTMLTQMSKSSFETSHRLYSM